MTRALAVGVLAVLVILVWLAMLAGWRHRAARQTRLLGLATLPAAPTEPGAPLTEDTSGVYVSTTTAGNWLDRITAYGLGARSTATMGVTTSGVSWLRQGAPDVFAPAASVVGARRCDGIAGKVVPPGGIVVVTWRLGATRVDTGFRPGTPAEADRLVAAVGRLAAAAATGGAA
ncbi:MAG TPA: transporter [Kineosporiaceae bacterium]|nr:transporter [Kineosporiaceae bacterium]